MNVLKSIASWTRNAALVACFMAGYITAKVLLYSLLIPAAVLAEMFKKR